MPRPVPKKWLRGPADDLAVREGCTFDAARGQRVCDFIEGFCKQSQGRWAGQPLVLLEWQRDFLMRLFSWVKPDGLRRYRSAYLEVPKKNGKSTLISALGIELLMADGEGGPEIHLNACDLDQARIVFNEAKRMVLASPGMASRLEVIDSQKRITYPECNGVIRANSADVPSKDGVNASAVIFDELHRQKTRAMWDIFEYAGAAREQPLKISITTAGESDEGVWYEQRTYSEKVNDGTIPDTTHLGVIYRALDTDDLDDPATWKRANPSLGVTIKVADFATEWRKAKEVPSQLSNFKRLRLGIVCREDSAFLALEAWDACRATAAELARGDREPSYQGLDLSSINDLTALADLRGNPEEGFTLRMRFWLPAEDILELGRRHNVPYALWADQGWITLTPGATIDYEWVRREVNELAAEGLEQLLCDPYNARQLLIRLTEDDGLPVAEIRQGFLSLSAPTKELERLVLAGKIRHDGNPVMRWMVGNAVAVRDEAGNVKLSKRRSAKKIDGPAALVNAIAAATSGEAPGESIYESQGIRTI